MSDDFQRDYLSLDSKEHKWGRGKGKLKFAWVRWGKNNWCDIRIMRRTDDAYVHTKRGIRMTADQLRKVIPTLVEMLEHMDTHNEEEARRKLRDGEDDEGIPSQVETAE